MSKKEMNDSINKEKGLAFINLKHVEGEGNRVEFAAVLVNPNTMSEEGHYSVPASEFSVIHKQIFNHLDGKVWISHQVESKIEELMEKFKVLGEEIPEAYCKIDTAEFFADGSVGSSQLHALAKFYGVCDEAIEEESDYQNHGTMLDGCSLLHEVFLTSLAAKGLKEILGKNL